MALHFRYPMICTERRGLVFSVPNTTHAEERGGGGRGAESDRQTDRQTDRDTQRDKEGETERDRERERENYESAIQRSMQLNLS